MSIFKFKKWDMSTLRKECANFNVLLNDNTSLSIDSLNVCDAAKKISSQTLCRLMRWNMRY